jgi:hypothetical protein
MDLNAQKEKFSLAYVHAVAAVAAAKVSRTDLDDDSIDVSLERSGGCAPRLDMQLKCTADAIPTRGDLSFSLKRKNYDDLRRPTVAPRWLIVMYVPENSVDWLIVTQTQDQVVLRHSAWWISLAGQPETENETSVTVTIRRANLFTPQVLAAKLTEIETQFTPL